MWQSVRGEMNMTIQRVDISVDVTPTVAHLTSAAVEMTATVVVDPAKLVANPTVIYATPGGTYHRRYWDMQIPGRTGYSQAEWHANRGEIFVAIDYLGGGDSSRPDDGDFMTLEVAADCAHHVRATVRELLGRGELVPGLAPIAGMTDIGIGQSLGGFITIIQQGKYNDYAGLGVFGSSPIGIANIHDDILRTDLTTEERRRMIMEENARTASVPELPTYHTAPRENFVGIFHVLDVPKDLWDYDVEHCSTLISRVSGVDGMTPGLTAPFAAEVVSPVFLAFGAIDVSANPDDEPSAYPKSAGTTLVVTPNMAHMHNFADTRQQLWDQFGAWIKTINN